MAEADPKAAESSVYPIMPLRNAIVFPDMMIPLAVGRPSSLEVVEEATRGEGLFVAVTQRDAEVEEPGPQDLHPVGTLVRILKLFRMNERSVSVIAQGVSRVRLDKVLSRDPYITAQVDKLESSNRTSLRAEAMAKRALALFEQFVELSPEQGPEQLNAMLRLNDPAQIADGLAHQINLSVAEQQEFLEELDVEVRLNRILEILARESQVLELGSKIHSEVLSKMNKAQREYYLREQLKAIKKELGQDDDGSVEIEDLREKVKASKMPEEVELVALREISRLERMHPSSAEYSVAHSYLDWLLELPWGELSEDEINLGKVRTVLDRDHFGLVDVKERIIEYLAVKSLKSDMKGPILCLVGPPGVGKTSLGRSVAEAMGRQFVRISLGGVRDEAELRGHRRTYVGALPGRIIQAIRKAGTMNPVVMLDELDKVGRDFRGDPTSVLLEVLDPEQNSTFSDHYLEVDFDLSKVLFLANANVLDTIPAPLLDRMEILRLPGYTMDDKVQIARKHLLPKVLEDSGLTRKDVSVPAATMRTIIGQYTREAGLRQLSKQLSKVARKVALQRVEGKKGKLSLAGKDLPEFLGPPRFQKDVRERVDRAGVATGLAWTPSGGDVLFIEAAAMPGKGRLEMTGQLGDVMKESGRAALSLLRSNASRYGLDRDVFDSNDVHVHVPAGAIPKDGPSAGVAMTAALLSIFRGIPLRSDVAMTGEITLRGKVLPIGGVKEKLLAARNAGIKEVVFPLRNESDVVDLEEKIKKGMKIHLVKDIDEALKVLFRAKDRSKIFKTTGKKRK